MPFQHRRLAPRCPQDGAADWGWGAVVNYHRRAGPLSAVSAWFP